MGLPPELLLQQHTHRQHQANLDLPFTSNVDSLYSITIASRFLFDPCSWPHRAQFAQKNTHSLKVPCTCLVLGKQAKRSTPTTVMPLMLQLAAAALPALTPLHLVLPIYHAPADKRVLLSTFTVFFKGLCQFSKLSVTMASPSQKNS